MSARSAQTKGAVPDLCLGLCLPMSAHSGHRFIRALKNIFYYKIYFFTVPQKAVPTVRRLGQAQAMGNPHSTYIARW